MPGSGRRSIMPANASSTTRNLMTAAIQPAEPTWPAERARRGGRAGKRAAGAAAFEQPPFRQLKIPFDTDEADLRRRAGIDPSRLACGCCREIGVDVLHDEARSIMKAHGADVREGDGARPLRQRHDPRADRARAVGIHAACAQPCAQCALRRQQPGLCADGVGAELLRHRPRPPAGQSGGFPQFPASSRRCTTS